MFLKDISAPQARFQQQNSKKMALLIQIFAWVGPKNLKKVQKENKITVNLPVWWHTRRATVLW